MPLLSTNPLHAENIRSNRRFRDSQEPHPRDITSEIFLDSFSDVIFHTPHRRIGMPLLSSVTCGSAPANFGKLRVSSHPGLRASNYTRVMHRSNRA
jgi:hypothetical protein